ncbi:amidohydrolase family protein [Gordonia sp. TBRC 11910]|uniref:Amidohydrolase family protein n=1 Tax=Gordonia asplenii TaxID=2725283 RepID=A0A848KP51_9ACTN|nr:amidohydrolase family protein [Gordonia asplenii]NMO00012.1 amidohydrolase family protein [Gordonia asplenii]
MATQLLVSGHVYTPASPDATAMAVTDGVVVWVGSDAVGAALHPDAEVIDLGGRFVAPAFVDSHVHLTPLGLALSGRTAADAVSAADLLDRLRVLVGGLSRDAVVIQGGWDESTWTDRRIPTTEEIDAVVGDRLVYLSRVDEHSALASSALRAAVPELAGMTGVGVDGPLTGDAHHAVRAAARASLSAGQRATAQRRALDHCAAAGIVAVHENGGPEIAGLDDFRAVGDLDHPVAVRRLWGAPVASAAQATAVLAETGADGLAGDLFVDGSLGSRTALLSEPYADDLGTSGVEFLDAEQIYTHLRACTDAGVQAGFHVIGDRAMAGVVDALDRLAAQLPTASIAKCAHRVEHAEMVTAAQAATLARCGVIASMQPAFDAAWGGPGALYRTRLGDRADGLNDFAMLAKTGVALSFSSDAPVTQVDPWATVRAAVHHHTSTSAVSARAAFAACTRGGWRAAGINDGMTGTLVPGAPAHYAVWEVEDFVVAGSDEKVQRWSTDPRSRVPSLPDVAPGATLPTCVATVSAGRAIFGDIGVGADAR